MNAHNKKRITILLVAMTLITQAGLVLYTPAFIEIAHGLGISATSVKTTLTAYLLGFGISQLFYGIISDRIGRKKPLLFGMLIFSLGCIWSMFTNNYTSLLLSRLVQGIGAGSCMTLSRCIARDCFNGNEYVRVTSLLSSGFAIGLGVTPVIGGHIAEHLSWRFEFFTLFMLGLVLLAGILFYLPETHIKRRKNESTKKLITTCKSILKNRGFLSYLIGGVMAYGIVITYTTISPFIIQADLGYGASFYGWMTLLVAASYYLGTWANRVLIKNLAINHILTVGIAMIFIAGVALLALQTIFHCFTIYSTIIPLLIATFGQALIWSNCIAGALKNLASVAGTAAALFGCIQMLLSAGLSAIIAIPAETSLLPAASIIICLSVIALIAFHGLPPKKPTLNAHTPLATDFDTPEYTKGC